MAKKEAIAKYKETQKVLYAGQTWTISLVLKRPTGFYYALENKLGLVSEKELIKA